MKYALFVLLLIFCSALIMLTQFHLDGGMIAPSGISIDKLGGMNDDIVVVCASVTVGH